MQELAIDKRINEENVFFAAYIIWMIAGVFKLTQFNEIDILSTSFNYMQYLAYLLLVGLFFMRRRDTVKDVICIALILACCILADYSVYVKQIIPAAIFLYFSLDFDFRKILKCTLILQAAIMAVTIAASAAGIIENIVYSRGGVDWYSLGYNYRTYAAHLVLFMTLMWFCLRKKIQLLEIVAALALNYIFFLLTNGRTDFILAIIGILGFTVWQLNFRKKWLNTLREFVVKFGFVIAAVVSILAQMFYNPENALMAAANTVLSGRLNLGHMAIENYGLSLFGHQVRWIGMTAYYKDPTLTYNCVDNSYLLLGISYGLVFLALLAIGFYFAGKYLIANKEYKLSWAMIVAFAYFIINLYMFHLSFNVFILLLGCSAWKPGETARMPMRDWLAVHLNEKNRGLLRTGLLFIVLCIVTFVQCRGTGYGTSFSRMYAWICAGFLLLLGCLCWEKEFRKNTIRGSRLGKWILLFLALACVSDFFISKQYRFSAFALLAFGGFFFKCWETMDQPGHLIRDFKIAFKIWFAISVIYCILCRPSQSGICYSGMYPRADAFALSMLIAMVIFLSDLKQDSGLAYNGVGFFCSLYFLWLSKRTIILLVACLVLILYLVYQIACRIRRDHVQKKDTGQQIRWRQWVFTLVVSLSAVLLIRELLPWFATSMGTQVVYETDKGRKIGVTILQLTSLENWQSLFQTKWDYCVAYVQNLNLLGHSSLLKIGRKNHWSPNGILMVAYRYGILAGISYAGVLVGYLVKAVKSLFAKWDFLPTGLAVSCVIVGMFVTIEQPFVCLSWMVLWLGIGWISINKG